MRVYGGGLHGRQYFHNTGYAVAGRALGSSTYHVPFDRHELHIRPLIKNTRNK